MPDPMTPSDPKLAALEAAEEQAMYDYEIALEGLADRGWSQLAHELAESRRFAMLAAVRATAAFKQSVKDEARWEDVWRYMDAIASEVFMGMDGDSAALDRIKSLVEELESNMGRVR